MVAFGNLVASPEELSRGRAHGRKGAPETELTEQGVPKAQTFRCFPERTTAENTGRSEGHGQERVPVDVTIFWLATGHLHLVRPVQQLTALEGTKVKSLLPLRCGVDTKCPPEKAPVLKTRSPAVDATSGRRLHAEGSASDQSIDD